MVLKYVNSDAEFDSSLKAVANGSLAVLYFTASWCGPCQRIAPIVDNMAKQYNAATFLKIDVDKAERSSGAYQVSSIPTFAFVRNGKELERISGADHVKLQKTVEKYYVQEFAPGSGGQTLGGGNGSGRSVLLDRYPTPTAPAAASATPTATPTATSATPTATPTATPAPASTKAAPEVQSQPMQGQPNPPASEPAKPSSSVQLEDILPKKKFMKCSATGKLFKNTAEATKYAKETGRTDFEEVTESYNPLSKSENQKIYELTDMGYSELRCQKALIRTNDGTIETCVDWLISHGHDADIDEPLQADELQEYFGKVKEKPKLSFEEQQALIKERIEKARATRAAEEAQQQRERELMRRRQGQEVVEARRNFEDEQMKKDLELKKKEKEAERLAREKILKQIEEDKKERQRRFGGGSASSQNSQSIPQPTPQPTAPSSTAQNHTSCTVQVRMFDGSTIRLNYRPSDNLIKLYDEVAAIANFYEFKIVTMFPRKTYSGAALATTTMLEAGLVPNGTVSLGK
eukprot:TRINITY_DN95_c0_g1_i7.p1 TRINITY_DN95_c0_g1~~TRINITY_DN95_c0_g1_i7.p1  ORF type:complete len:519 (+),score=135.12 TRINITY_DN95_c0_g1_i7:95-1651(+)